jgi:hypothetical protein
VSLNQNGFTIDSLTGNCYQVSWSHSQSKQVFWNVTDCATEKGVCIEVEEAHALPMGDILAAILLSLYDDIESSELISTLKV